MQSLHHHGADLNKYTLHHHGADLNKYTLHHHGAVISVHTQKTLTKSNKTLQYLNQQKQHIQCNCEVVIARDMLHVCSRASCFIFGCPTATNDENNELLPALKRHQNSASCPVGRERMSENRVQLIGFDLHCIVTHPEMSCTIIVISSNQLPH